MSLDRTGTETTLLLCAMLALAGCDDTERAVGRAALTEVPELRGCVYVKLNMPGAPYLHVIRCPNSSTTTAWRYGKNGQGSATVVSQ